MDTLARLTPGMAINTGMHVVSSIDLEEYVIIGQRWYGDVSMYALVKHGDYSDVTWMTVPDLRRYFQKVIESRCTNAARNAALDAAHEAECRKNGWHHS